MGATWASATSAVPEVETNDDGDITKIKDDKLYWWKSKNRKMDSTIYP